jgi:hypothetical protein
MVARPPAATIRVALSCIADSVRPLRNTCAPLAPIRSAMARPIPLEAPVTTAVCPERSTCTDIVAPIP